MKRSGIFLEEGNGEVMTMGVSHEKIIRLAGRPEGDEVAHGAALPLSREGRSPSVRLARTTAVAVIGQDGVATIAAPFATEEGASMSADFGQLASTALALPLSRVRWETPVETSTTFDERGLRVALNDAGTKLQRALIALATITEGSPLHGFPIGALEARGGAVQPRSGRGPAIGYGELLRLARKSEIRAQGELPSAGPAVTSWGSRGGAARPAA